MNQGRLRRRGTRVTAILAAAALMLCAPLGPSAHAAGRGPVAGMLDGNVADTLGNARLGSSHVSVCVIDLQSGQVLAALNEDEPMAPASNLKLLTSGSALLALGSDYRFETRFVRDGDKLVVVGSGDPGFADPVLLDEMRMSVDDFLNRIVDSIKAANAFPGGIGEVVVDDRVFDRQYIHPDWPADQLNRWYCAEVSGLNFHANVMEIFPSPGRGEDSPAVIRTEPSAPWLSIAVKARTTTRGQTAIWASRDADANRFTVHGSVRTTPQVPVEVTTHEASELFGHLLADKLAAAGLAQAGGRQIPARLAGDNEQLNTDAPALAVVSTPMSVALERCNVDSHNLYAETMLKAVGHAVTTQPGSWSNGAAVVRMQVRDLLGPEAASLLVMNDGSGLSKNDRVTAEMLARWLVAVGADPKVGEAYVDSLALAGEDGTMKKRFRGKNLDNEVRAKSGYINGVRTLSGFVTHPGSGRRVAFSILVNDIPPSVAASKVKEFHEKVVMLADDWLAEQTAGWADAHKPQEAMGGGE